jgi:hypothetical protein
MDVASAARRVVDHSLVVVGGPIEDVLNCSKVRLADWCELDTHRLAETLAARRSPVWHAWLWSLIMHVT